MFERRKKRREARPPAAKGRAALPIGVSRTVSCTKNEGKENPAEENLRAGVTAVNDHCDGGVSCGRRGIR